MAQPHEGGNLARDMALREPWIDHFFVGPLQMRCSVVTDPVSGDTIIIDGGDEPQRIIDWVDAFEGPGPNWTTGPDSAALAEERGLPKRRVVALVNTHAHFDHSGFIPVLREHYGVEWYLHPDDDFLQTLAQASGRRYGLSLPEPAEADCAFEAGKTYAFGTLEMSVLHTQATPLVGVAFWFPSRTARIMSSWATRSLQGRLVEPILPIPAVILPSWLGPFTPNCGRWTKTPWSIRGTVH